MYPLSYAPSLYVSFLISENKAGGRKLLEAMNMLLAQFVDLVSQVYAYLQTHQVVYLKSTALCVLFASQRH